MGNETPSSAPGEQEDPLHRIGDALQEITPLLDAIAPDASQTNWSASQGRIEGAVALYKGEVLPALDAFKPLSQEADLHTKLALNVAWVGAELAALLYASKRTDDAQALLLRALMGMIVRPSKMGSGRITNAKTGTSATHEPAQIAANARGKSTRARGP